MSTAPTSHPQRSDKLPVWVIVLLVVFLVLRIADLIPSRVTGKPTSHRLSARLSQAMDEETIADLVGTTSAAKTAFFGGLGTLHPEAKLDKVSLKSALDSAEKLQKDTGNSPGAARRVIILRDLTGLPPLAPSKKGLPVLDAFGASLPATTTPHDRAEYAYEARIWTAVAQKRRLSPAELAQMTTHLRHIPGINWWINPALVTLYRSQGDTARASNAAQSASEQAANSLLTFGLLVIAGFILFLMGLLLWIFLIARRSLPDKPLAPGEKPFPDLWPVIPEVVPLASRRLGSGDLMGVFVLYLLFPNILGYLLGGFRGIGSGHFLSFAGVFAPYRASLLAGPRQQLELVTVALSAGAYLVSALVCIGLLYGIAKRRGASVGNELGWNVQRFRSNILYGFLGYAVALPLFLAAAMIGPVLFKHAPTPENPAITMLATASTHWTQVILVLLATVAAPLTEEFLFRGVFYNAVKLRYGVWPGIVLTGLIFGFVHPVGIAAMLPLGVLGGVFAWMAETRKSLVPSMVAHCIQNTGATLALLLMISS